MLSLVNHLYYPNARERYSVPAVAALDALVALAFHSTIISGVKAAGSFVASERASTVAKVVLGAGAVATLFVVAVNSYQAMQSRRAERRSDEVKENNRALANGFANVLDQFVKDKSVTHHYETNTQELNLNDAQLEDLQQRISAFFGTFKVGQLGDYSNPKAPLNAGLSVRCFNVQVKVRESRCRSFNPVTNQMTWGYVSRPKPCIVIDAQKADDKRWEKIRDSLCNSDRFTYGDCHLENTRMGVSEAIGVQTYRNIIIFKERDFILEKSDQL